jgi:hypothetical protein
VTNGLASQQCEKNVTGKALASIFRRMPETEDHSISKGDMPAEIEAEP